MKKWICLLLVAMLLAPALAEEDEAEYYDEYEEEYEEYEDEDYDDSDEYDEYGDYEYEDDLDYEDEWEESIDIGDGQRLQLGEEVQLDLDGDGTEESVCAIMEREDEMEFLSVSVEAGENFYEYDSDVIYGGAAYAADMDGDGNPELLLTGDEASADYFTWCLKFSREDGLNPLPFADANRGENTGDYYESGYGRIVAIDGQTLTMVGSQDALGTWMCSRQFTLRDGKFELDDGGIWIVVDDLDDPDNWEYRCLTVAQPISVTLEDGSQSTLEPGTKLLITETDKTSFAGYQTEDGQRGKISIAPDVEEGWGSLVDGKHEYDCFEYIPYAD